LKEAERMLKHIDLEVTTNYQLDSGKMKGYSSEYKKKFEDFKSRFFKIKENFTYTKKMEEMILISQKEAEQENSVMQLKMQDGRDLLQSNMNEKLENAKRSALTIENTSKNIMFDLENQSHQLKITNLKVNNLNKSIESSNSVISKMLNRENRSKAVIGVFSVTLLTFFLFVLSSRF
jgi:hypothetical protein